MVVVLTLVQVYRVARTGVAAKTELLRAENDLLANRLDVARRHLKDAERGFAAMRGQLGLLGPVAPLARITPLVRVQVRGVEVFSDSGGDLARAGIELVDAARALTNPADPSRLVESSIEPLRTVQQSIQPGLAALDKAIGRVHSLDGYRLFGPIDGARNELIDRLPRIRARAESAREGLGALIAFAGGSGPRRYLVFSQNPDEARPTGGYLGTYGVLNAEAGKLSLERYDSIESWVDPRPDATVPKEAQAVPFRDDPALTQTIANVNVGPDWPTAARLAMDLWQRGGEAPVDGVVSITPALLARVLAVVGPVEVPAYGETVDTTNVIERLDFHTHVDPPATGDRKAFVSDVAHVVLDRLLHVPASQWPALAGAIGAAFGQREAMVWVADPVVQAVVADRAWDGAFPETAAGDFFYDGEFSYAAKNGRHLHRVYDHHVVLRPDGSARVTTTLTITNTLGPDALQNPSSLSYLTLYGPTGAVLDSSSDDPDMTGEASGHPSASWYRAADPLGTTSVTVAWDAPAVAVHEEDGSWVYGLWWMHTPDHAGDVVNLRVDLPPQWRWSGPPPPTTRLVDQDIVGTWKLEPRGRK